MDKSIKPLNVCINLSNLVKNKLCPEIVQLLRYIRPSWYENEGNLTKSVKYKVLTGGLSNHMVAYYTEGTHAEDVVIVRVNGEEIAEGCLSKEKEIENIQVLHKAGLGPPLYATFNNGISHGFVQGVPLDETSIRDKHIQRLIAKEMLAFHRVEADTKDTEPGIWKLFHSMLDRVPSLYNDPTKNTILRNHIRPYNVLRDELHSLKHHLDQLKSPLVFCHNDLRPTNILYDQVKDSVTFIDVELAMYNNEHFDIGNHFMEHAGTDSLDITNYPDKDYQLSWLRFYLEEQAVQNGGSRTEVTERDVEECYIKAPTLGWAIWGLVMAERSRIDFDYLGYARKRFDAYFSRKADLLSWNIKIKK